MKKFLILVIFMFLLSSQTFADLTLKYVGKGIFSDESMIMFFSKSAMRTDAGKTSMIYREVPKREMIIINHQTKEYFVMDEAYLQQMKMMMEQMMAQMPPEARAMAETIMQNQKKPQIHPCEHGIVKGKEKINGILTTVIERCEIDINGHKEQAKFWVAEINSAGIKEKDFEICFHFVDFYTQFYSNFLKQIDIKYISNEDEFLRFGIKKPLLVKQAVFKNGKIAGEILLINISKKPIPSSIFNIPAGYKKMNMAITQ